MEWISVKDELPPTRLKVLACVKHTWRDGTFYGTVDFVERWPDGWMNVNESGYLVHGEVTHWMPMPELPGMYDSWQAGW